MQRWRQWMAAVLDWNEVDKSLFVVVALTPILVGYVLGIGYTLSLPNREHLVYVPALQQLQALQTALIGGALIIAVLCLMLRRRHPHAIWVQHLATQYYTLTLVASSYFVGTLTFATGVVLLGAPVLGFILLDRRVVWWSTGVGMSALLGLTYANAFGLIPYAPAVLPPGDGITRLWWINTMYLFSLPHVLVILFFADQTVSRWREREDTIRRLSSTDMLTGLHNRRSIMEQLEKEVARSCRDGQPLTVVILDLDFFKKINDTWGHPTGDRALQAAADAVRGTLRQGDVVGRYGGEEFMLLLPATPVEGARVLLERCRVSLAEAVVAAESGADVRLSGSFGVASNERCPTLDAEGLIRLADSALYRAKECGRNRVEVMTAVAA